MSAPESREPLTFTNDDGITFEPYVDEGVIGYRVTEEESGRVEYIVLSPSGMHQFNEANGALADTFIYVIAGDDALDFEAESDTSIVYYHSYALYVNHFARADEVEEGEGNGID